MAIDNVPKKRRALTPDFVSKMNNLVVYIPKYGSPTFIFSTDATIQEGINYTLLSASGIVSSSTIPDSGLPTSLVINKPGWIHVDGRNGVVVRIDGLPVCRANNLVRPINEYCYATGIFPVGIGNTVSWTIPEGSYLTLRYIPYASL